MVGQPLVLEALLLLVLEALLLLVLEALLAELLLSGLLEAGTDGVEVDGHDGHPNDGHDGHGAGDGQQGGCDGQQDGCGQHDCEEEQQMGTHSPLAASLLQYNPLMKTRLIAFVQTVSPAR